MSRRIYWQGRSKGNRMRLSSHNGGTGEGCNVGSRQRVGNRYSWAVIRYKRRGINVTNTIKGVSDESRLLPKCSDQGCNRPEFLWQRGRVFNLGPTVEVAVLVHDFLIKTMLAHLCMSRSHMGYKEHSWVKGRFQYSG